MTMLGPNPGNAGGSIKSRTRFESNFEDHVSRYRFASGFALGRRVLDYGCGDGYGARHLVSAGAVSVMAVDIDDRALQRAKRSRVPPNLSFVNAHDFPDLVDRQTLRFELITCLEVLEHVPPMSGRRLLAQFNDWLEEGGTLILSTPNWEVTRLSLSIADRPLNPFHIKEYSGEELKNLIDFTGFHIVEAYGQSPSDPGAEKRVARARNTALVGPIRRLIGSRFFSLPLSVRSEVFRTATAIGWVGLGSNPRGSRLWSISKIRPTLEEPVSTFLIVAARRPCLRRPTVEPTAGA